MTNNKALFNFKKILFIILFVIFQIGYIYYFLFCFYDFSFFQKTILYDALFQQELPQIVILIVPVNLIITALIWIFYRKEVSLYGRMLFSLAFAWSISYHCWDWTAIRDFVLLLPAAVDIIIDVFLIKEALRYPKFTKAPDSARAKDKGDVPDDERQ